MPVEHGGGLIGQQFEISPIAAGENMVVSMPVYLKNKFVVGIFHGQFVVSEGSINTVSSGVDSEFIQ